MLAKKQLIEKQKKIPDYYDVSILIDQCLKRDSVQIGIKERKENNSEINELKGKICDIEKRLNDLEQIVNDYLEV